MTSAIRRQSLRWVAVVALLVGCGDKDDTASDADGTDGEHAPSDLDSGAGDTGEVADTGELVDTSGDGGEDTGSSGDTGTATDTGLEPIVPDWPEDADPFADAVVSFEPGEFSGFGDIDFPDVVLGPPEGGGASVGSLDVLSLGREGTIVLEMTDLEIVDGPGPDLLVFENPFGPWLETGVVSASEDGETWFEWPCDPEDLDGGYPGCAGVSYVYATSDFFVDPTDPEAAGGDAFDLADLGLSRARFVRIRDSGFNEAGYNSTSGGFDLDAISAANWAVIDAPEDTDQLGPQ